MAERLSWKFASPMKYPNGSSLSLPSLDALKVDVLVASLIGAAQHATTTIPIVFIASDPVGSKLVNSLARPGGNSTGVTTTTDELSGKRLSLFKEAFPRMTRV